MKEIERWKFAEKNDLLVNLVLKGKKTATTSIYKKDYKNHKYSIICYSNGQDACKIKTKKTIKMKFKDMVWNLAKLEGENNNLQDWISQHEKFFKSIDKDFNKDTIIEFEIFELVETYNNT